MKAVIFILALLLQLNCLKTKKSSFDFSNPKMNGLSVFFLLALFNTPSSASSSAPTVSGLYTQSPLINDYLANDGSTVLKASGASCNTASGGGYNSCIHAGIFKKAAVSGQTSCDNLSASDELGIFQWKCETGSTSVFFVNTGFQEGKHLSSLIDFSAKSIKKNSVIIKKSGSEIGRSASEIWWSNTVIEKGSTGGTLDTGSLNPIYILNSSSVSGTLIFGAGKTALLANPGITVTVSASPAVQADNISHIWLEGNFRHAGTSNGISLTGIRYSHIRNLSVSGNYSASNNSGLVIDSAENCFFSDIRTTGNIGQSTTSGLRIIQSGTGNLKGNIFRNIVSGNNEANNIVVNDNASGGIISNNIFNNITSVASGGGGAITAGILLWRQTAGGKTSGNVFINTSSLNSIGANTDGLEITSAANTDQTQLTFMNTLLVNSQASGMTMSGSGTGAYSRFIFLNTASCGNSASGANQLSMGGTPIDYNYFTGKFLLESTANSCNSTNGNSAGYSNSSPCTAGGSSDFTAQSFSIGASDMIGQTNDTVNANGAASGSGTAFASVTDWSNFSSIYRSWGIYNSASLFSTSHRGRCSSGTCSIWDVSLKSAGSSVRAVVPQPGGNDTLRQIWNATDQTSCEKIKGASWGANYCSAPNITSQAACDAISAGDWGTSKCSTVFLRNAMEIFGDGIGNDNGLCESGENCIYTPNIGSYQGHGDLVSLSTISSGTLSSINLYKYSVNGY